MAGTERTTNFTTAKLDFWNRIHCSCTARLLHPDVSPEHPTTTMLRARLKLWKDACSPRKHGTTLQTVACFSDLRKRSAVAAATCLVGKFEILLPFDQAPWLVVEPESCCHFSGFPLRLTNKIPWFFQVFKVFSRNLLLCFVGYMYAFSKTNKVKWSVIFYQKKKQLLVKITKFSKEFTNWYFYL